MGVLRRAAQAGAAGGVWEGRLSGVLRVKRRPGAGVEGGRDLGLCQEQIGNTCSVELSAAACLCPFRAGDRALIERIVLRDGKTLLDTLTRQQRSARMARVGSKDTSPEWTVRRLLHRMGYRYRLHASDLPGRPDLVFRARRKVVFVHGCFWHQHSAPSCTLARQPKSRQEFWLPKFKTNVARDERVQADLAELGWEVFVVWECQLRDLASLGRDLREFLE